MARTEDYQVIMKEKFARQELIPELEYHAHGHCVHIGQISAGCRGCYTGEPGGGIQVGMECMCNCPMCYYDPNRKNDWETQKTVDNKLADFFFMDLQSGSEERKPVAYSYQSTGETLMYMDNLEQFSVILQNINRRNGIHMYHHVYTNGLLANDDTLDRLKRMGAHELRFHVTASNCSKTVIKNMYKAARKGFIVSIEEPSWNLNRDQIFKMLPILDDVGGKHLDIVEIQLTEFNLPNIDKFYPDGRIYKDAFYHLYDEGFVYDIMEEVVAKGYDYSVLDCSSAVERCRQVKRYEGFEMKSIEGMCRPHDHFKPRPDGDKWYDDNIKNSTAKFKLNNYK